MALSHIQTPTTRVPVAEGEVERYGLDRDGGVVRRLGVWVGASHLTAVRVWRSISINRPQTLGTVTGTYHEITFVEDERVTSLTLLHTTGGNRRSAGFRLTTSRGRSFEPRITTQNSLGHFPIDVSSGIPVGVHGRVLNGQLNSLGIAFLLPIVMMRMINLRYPTLDSLVAAGIQPLTVIDFRDENHSAALEKVWSNTGSYTTTESSSWSETEGMNVFASVSVSGRVPFVGSVGAEAGWELSQSSTLENGKEVSTTTEWTRSGVISARHWLTFQITTRKGTISLPYEASMEVALNNNLVFSYPISGIFSGVSYTRFDIVINAGSLDASQRDNDLLERSTTCVKAASPGTISMDTESRKNEFNARVLDLIDQISKAKLGMGVGSGIYSYTSDNVLVEEGDDVSFEVDDLSDISP